MTMDIGGGFILKGAKTLDAAYKRIPGWLESSYIRGRQLSQKAIVGLATEFYDQSTCVGDHGFKDVAKTPYDAAYEWIKGELEAGNPTYSLGTMIAIGVARNKRVIGVLHSDSKQMREHFMSLPDIAPYDYSVVSGKPKKVSEKQWEQRREDWESMEINDQYVHMVEYVFIGSNVMFIPSRDDDVILPSYESRLHKVARAHTMTECRNDFGLHSEHQVIEFMLRNPIYTQRLEAALEQVGRRLDKELTLEKLQETV